MIVGFGSDVVRTARIGRAWARFGSRWTDRLLHPDERAACMARFGALAADRAAVPAPAVAWLARRFAAKEAAAKALGTGLGGAVGWREIVIVNDDRGRPGLRFEGGAAQRATAMGVVRAHLSLTDDAGVAFAVVVLEGA